MMVPSKSAALAATLLASLLAPEASPLAAQAGETYRLAGDRVAIYNLAGRVEIRGGEGPEVEVSVLAGGEDAARLRVETGPVAGAETLRVIYPEDRVVYEEQGRNSRTRIRVRPDGTFGDGGRQVRVAGSGAGLRAHADLVIAVPPGKQVAVHHGAGELSASAVTGDLLLDTSAGRVTVRGGRGDLSIDTGSGSVEVIDLQGDLRVDTGSGGVHVSGVRGTHLNVDTGSGSVRVSDVRSDQLRVDTGSGGIRLAGVHASDLRLDTGSGGVDAELLSDVRSVVIDTGSGSVTLALPEGAGADVDVETGSGRIDVDLPMTVTRTGRNRLSGRIGDGGGTIRIETGSGRIRLLGGR